jgi:uncharacterized delta-60 repeat protein
MRLNADGTRDTTFNQTVNAFNVGANDPVWALAVQPDGKIIIGGRFTSYNGNLAANDYVMRLNANGTRDTSFISFDSIASANAVVNAVALQSDGKIIIGGGFNSYNGDSAASDGVMRLNADGTRDTSFNSAGTGSSGAVNGVVIQPDGKIIIGGFFTSYNGEAAASDCVMRLNANGTRDTTFNPGGTGANDPVNAVAIQPDGKIIIGGFLTSYNGDPAASDHLMRLDNDLFITWPAGDATDKTILLPINNDAISEADETLTLTLTVISGGATLGSPSSSELIIHDPGPPTITAGGPTTFCDGGSVTLTSSSASGNQWCLDGNPIVGGTNQNYIATASGDYTVVVRGLSSAMITMTVNPIPEMPKITPSGLETLCGSSIVLTSTSASGNQWYLNGNHINGATNQQYVATVPGNYAVIVTASGCSSAASAATTVRANQQPVLSYQDQAVPVNGSLTIKPATGPSDNTTVSSIGVQSKGTYTGTVSVNQTTGVVSISNAAPAGIHIITIRASDNCGATTDATFQLFINSAVPFVPVPFVQFSANSYSFDEGAGHGDIIVTRTGDLSSAVTVDYQTSDQSGKAPCPRPNTGMASSGCDYGAAAGTLRFAAGESQKTIRLVLIDDEYVDGDEQLTIKLSNPQGTNLNSPDAATVWIIDNDRRGRSPNR